MFVMLIDRRGMVEFGLWLRADRHSINTPTRVVQIYCRRDCGDCGVLYLTECSWGVLAVPEETDEPDVGLVFRSAYRCGVRRRRRP